MTTNLKNPVIIIYHGNCPDGFASALAAQLFLKKARNYKSFKDKISYYKGKHGNLPPDCSGKEVYILDFSYKREQMKQLCLQAIKVTVIDHHISALKELENLELEHNNLDMIFDMNQSGAMLSWTFFHTTAAPKLYEHIQDNDLWHFDLSNTRTIIMAIMSYPMTFKLWTQWLTNEASLENLHQEGQILERSINRQIKHYAQAARMGKIAGHLVPIVNAPGSIGSDLLHQLSEGYAFAAAYEDKPGRRAWQLRSGGKKAIDVSKIAQQFGGGGHKNASGFSTNIEDIELSEAQPAF